MAVDVPGAPWDEGLPAKERFEYWRDVLGKTRDCDATSAHADSFDAELRWSELGPVAMFWTSFRSVRFVRNERMVRRADSPELYHLTLLTSGAQALRRGEDQRDKIGPGELSLVDNTTPYDVRVFGAGPEDAHAAGLGIDIPQPLLPVPGCLVRDLLGRGLSANVGSGAVLAHFLIGLERQAHTLQPAEAARLGTVVVDLVAAWIARELDALPALPQETRRRALMESVRRFIRHNLHDPDLTPATVAAAHHISLSYLHRVFTQESQGETVAAWIRSQRLKKAHHDLADPALRAVPIHIVAAQWGIPRADDFSRAFRAAYGISPSEHRHQAFALTAE
ncbi:AraC family transcriptional regulator [Streptomyces kaniharaensis]|uniref:AraC family transcriptional regulator n=1 Tax=Streptomyces kaniharaensis TaxID=212423 RepID=A0A6N7L0N9_9ACTN|nr:AraC family transcriptional regulator [Streptomyces kaniharaensis]MQS16237.1 AraC family transcriptional regulator [Streptomyces kaniharaensis]